MDKNKNDRRPLSLVGRSKLVERRNMLTARSTYLPRGSVCQLVNGIVIPGFDPTLSDKPYVAVTSTGNLVAPEVAYDNSYNVPKPVEFAGMFDNEDTPVVIIPLDQPVWFVLEAFNFPNDQIKTLQVGDWLTPACRIENDAIVYPLDLVGRWDRTPGVEEMPVGAMLPVIGTIREVSDTQVIVRSRAVIYDGILHVTSGYDPYPAILYRGAWDVQLGWDKALNWDQEI